MPKEHKMPQPEAALAYRVLYTIRDQDKARVDELIRKHPSLIPLLALAFDAMRASFPDSQGVLEVEGDGEQMLVSINTGITDDAPATGLGEWWQSSVLPEHGRVCVRLVRRGGAFGVLYLIGESRLSREKLAQCLAGAPAFTLPAVAAPFEDFEPLETSGLPASQLLIADRR
ncbi:MAG: hypothetical protein HY238_09255 [Acidobacteria bacterium]|nr:hypothetical protein [Acidobacteriota bacterium]